MVQGLSSDAIRTDHLLVDANKRMYEDYAKRACYYYI